MFDIGGYELILIAVVAILVVGPRELPGMLRSIGRFVSQARQTMSSVQRQFNDALKEAELDEVRQTINDVRSLNPATQIKNTIAKEMKPLTDVGDSLKASGSGDLKASGSGDPTALKAPKQSSAKAAQDTKTAQDAKTASKSADDKAPANAGADHGG